MTPEEIVEAVAALDPWRGGACFFCDHPEYVHTRERGQRRSVHNPRCPWYEATRAA